MKKDNYKIVRQVLLIILIANLLVAILKIIIGSMIKSASMTADGFHSLSDGSSNIVGLIGIQLASKPEDKEHPYGHNKFETLSGLFISVMLFMVGGKVIISAINRFNNPVIPNITTLSLIVLLFTLGINLFVSVTEYKKGKEMNSQILISDSMHTRSDIYVSLGVLATLMGVKLGLPPIIDQIASLIVACFILHAAYEIFKENSDVLVDKSTVDIEVIRDLVMSFEQVRDAHNIRSRGSQNDMYIDLHIMVDPHLSVEKSHELVHYIEEVIKANINKNAQVIAHIEPFIAVNSKATSFELVKNS
ncbi:cation diffusion facilitator family transporter [Sedimentibacter acidaminivorans]|uniref:Cation diffusion facilitator family transporter n=1 Tax=Sedimentibacter acidaminivorans TaxID=913099 RepID=A0ABS4GCI9_9FIRM|nr:cation diffusion facilitator family transporter [Sedimentibacter acidaminivorans]MBP1925374.1 cation diffusion facilitator family transporter [Sedimentibacter acidaminivorans]